MYYELRSIICSILFEQITTTAAAVTVTPSLVPSNNNNNNKNNAGSGEDERNSYSNQDIVLITGGITKSLQTGQILANIRLMEASDEGGAWGSALLAKYYHNCYCCYEQQQRCAFSAKDPAPSSSLKIIQNIRRNYWISSCKLFSFDFATDVYIFIQLFLTMIDFSPYQIV